jgi:hypothetical protein
MADSRLIRFMCDPQGLVGGDFARLAKLGLLQ